MPRVGELPRVLLLPLRPLGLAINPLLDRLTALPAGQPRSQARRWLYDGVLAALGLGIVVIVLDILAATLAPVVPFEWLSGLDEWAGALLAGLPILYFTGALITAFAEGGGQPMPAAPISLPVPVPVHVGAPLTLPPFASPYPSVPMPSSSTPIYPPPPTATFSANVENLGFYYYSFAGTYTVTLTVTDGAGQRASVSNTVIVQ